MDEPDVTPDRGRRERLGFDEAVFCAGKSPEQVARILEDVRARGESLLLTRIGPRHLAALPAGLRERLDYDEVSASAYLGAPAALRERTRVAVLTAGTSDLPVGREAARTLRYYGEPCRSVNDVGVAGLWRVLERVEEIRDLPVVIVVAGMDGALPSVVGGLVPGAVIAVPTSVGYGVATAGRAALDAMLASCAPGLTVVNVDNGYGAACAALRILRAAG